MGETSGANIWKIFHIEQDKGFFYLMVAFRVQCFDFR